MSDRSPAYQKYVLLTLGRTGSTLLSHMLRGHPCIVDYQELFNVDYTAEVKRNDDSRVSLSYWLNAFVDGKRTRPPETLSPSEEISAGRILERYVWHDDYLQCIGAVGFKLMDYQMEQDGPLGDVKDHVRARMPGLKVIYLTRENWLKQYLSHVVAERARQWHIADPRDRRPRPRVSLPPEKLQGVFAHYEKSQRVLSALAAKSSGVYDLTYEQFIGDCHRHWRAVQEFLGVPVQPTPETRLVKIENRSLSEAITNYRELKDDFAGSSWERFFDE